MTRDEVIRIFRAGVTAADPAQAVASALAERPFEVPEGRLVIIAVGKGAIAMHQGLGGLQADRTIIVTNPENASDVDGAEVFAAAHPVPDEIGLKAAEAVVAALRGLEARDAVLCLISGGGSSLLPSPVDGVSLEDKAALNRALLACGADIQGMNMVRQQVSRLKGGGLTRHAAPAKVRALILSDVVGDDLAVIASGPTVAPIGTRFSARQLLQDRGVWDGLPLSVRKALEGEDRDHAETQVEADNSLIGSNGHSVEAMAKAAGAEVQWHEAPLEGDVAEAAAQILALPKGLHVMGGETTVKITGTGRGGRNQELALRVAEGAKAAGWEAFCFLSGGTDGRDGPTDAAGGIVDQGTMDRLQGAGINVAEILQDNDSYRALKASGDLLITGGTGTNVADLQILWRA